MPSGLGGLHLDRGDADRNIVVHDQDDNAEYGRAGRRTRLLARKTRRVHTQVQRLVALDEVVTDDEQVRRDCGGRTRLHDQNAEAGRGTPVGSNQPGIGLTGRRPRVRDAVGIATNTVRSLFERQRHQRDEVDVGLGHLETAGKTRVATPRVHDPHDVLEQHDGRMERSKPQGDLKLLRRLDLGILAQGPEGERERALHGTRIIIPRRVRSRNVTAGGAGGRRPLLVLEKNVHVRRLRKQGTPRRTGTAGRECRRIRSDPLGLDVECGTTRITVIHLVGNGRTENLVRIALLEHGRRLTVDGEAIQGKADLRVSPRTGQDADREYRARRENAKTGGTPADECPEETRLGCGRNVPPTGRHRRLAMATSTISTTRRPY